MSEFVLTTNVILAMWAGGLAFGVSAVAYWRIVGRAFFWVAGGSNLLIGLWTVREGGPLAWVAIAAVIAGSLSADRGRGSSAAFALAGAAWVALAATSGTLVLAATGALALGGVTTEMLLGHWYLVDPKLPRWALKRLDVVGVGALILDAVVLIVGGAALGAVVGWAFLVLAVTSVLLMTGVWFSIKEPSYAGVMAATGLSYLAVLTALGATVAGRSLIGDIANRIGGGILGS